MLNAVKAFLIVKQQRYTDSHGVSGYSIGKQCLISNERVIFKAGGVLPALCSFLGETSNNEEYRLQDLLYNLVYIHRAFSLSLPTLPELFIPISHPQIVRSTTNNEAWFCADLEGKYASKHSVNKLGTKFEQDISISDSFNVRRKNRFRWEPQNKKKSLIDFARYHAALRKDLSYIYSAQRLWYLKRVGPLTGLINRSSLTIAFAAMHRLSELSRYSPDQLAKHFQSRYNWLLSEFITVAPLQFIDSISSEMTGHEFMPPGRTN
jgi:hypothetical protein